MMQVVDPSAGWVVSNTGLPHVIYNGVTIRSRGASTDGSGGADVGQPTTSEEAARALDGLFPEAAYSVAVFYDPARGVPALVTSMRAHGGFACEDQVCGTHLVALREQWVAMSWLLRDGLPIPRLCCGGPCCPLPPPPHTHTTDVHGPGRTWAGPPCARRPLGHRPATRGHP
jgi:hypothetical protein